MAYRIKFCQKCWLLFPAATDHSPSICTCHRSAFGQYGTQYTPEEVESLRAHMRRMEAEYNRRIEEARATLSTRREQEINERGGYSNISRNDYAQWLNQVQTQANPFRHYSYYNDNSLPSAGQGVYQRVTNPDGSERVVQVGRNTGIDVGRNRWENFDDEL